MLLIRQIVSSPFSNVLFRKQAEMEGKPLLVQCVEVSGVEHRDMLSDDTVFHSILEFLGKKRVEDDDD